MKFALVIGVLIVAIVAVQSQPADPCAADSCQACGQRSADCHYCAVQVENDLLQKDVLGVCVGQDVNCTDVSFGSSVATLLAGLEIFLGLPSQNVEVSFDDEQRCKDTFTADELKYSTCLDCVAQNFFWTQFGNADSPGLCLRKDLVLFFDFLPFGTSETAAACNGNPGPPPSPSAVCEENLSCSSCADSPTDCDWCGGQLTVNQTSIFSLKGGSEDALNVVPLFGTCRTRSSTDTCASVKFGTIDNFFQIGELLGYTDFSVQERTRGEGSCDGIRWLESLKKDCQTCVADNQVFCNWNLNLPIPLPGTFAGGLCLPMDLALFCQTLSINALPSTPIVDAGGCPA